MSKTDTTQRNILRSLFSFEKGSVKIILGLTIPVLCELLLSSLFGMVDYMMAGQHSTHALNAIGLFSSPSALLTVLFTSINTGTTIRVAWNVGAGRMDSAKRVMRTSIILNAYLGIIITIASIFFAPQMIEFMSGTDYGSIYEKGTVAYDGVQVFQICALGFVFQGVTASITATLRGAGENRIPLFYNMLANFLNVIGNYVFIYGIEPLGIPEMAAQGAALSTSLSRVIGLLLAIGYLLVSKRSKFGFRNKEYAVNFNADNEEAKKKYPFFIADPKITSKILTIGFPSMLESLVLQLGMVLFSKMIISTGQDGYAAHQIANSMNNMFLTVCTAFSSAAGTLVGQNLGARNIEGAKYYTRAITKLSFMSCSVTAIMIWLFARKLTHLYTSDEAVISYAANILIICGFIVILTSFQNCLSGALKGAGDTKFPLYSAIFCVLFIRVSLTYVVVNVLHLGIVHIWLVTLTDVFIRSIIIYLRYKSGRWEKYSKKALEN